MAYQTQHDEDATDAVMTILDFDVEAEEVHGDDEEGWSFTARLTGVQVGVEGLVSLDRDQAIIFFGKSQVEQFEEREVERLMLGGWDDLIADEAA